MFQILFYIIKIFVWFLAIILESDAHKNKGYML